MKLTRKHELALIDIGLETLLNKILITKKPEVKEKKKLHWTQRPENKARVRKTMKKLWKAKNNK